MAETQIILIRHGEAASSWSDHPDPGLSDEGQGQAALTGKSLSEEYANHQLLSSPKKRAMETMDYVSKGLKKDFLIDGRFIEIPAIGVPQDQKQKWLMGMMETPIADLPIEILKWRKDLIDWLDACREPVIVGTHFMVINVLVSYLLSHPRLLYFHPSYASKTEILMQDHKIKGLILGDEKKTNINL